MRRHTGKTSLLAVTIVLVACSERSPSGPEESAVPLETPVTTLAVGAIAVTVFTSGPDQDADGYVVDAASPKGYQYSRLPVTGSHTFTGIRPGDVEVQLYGLATNCGLDGPNPRTVNVKAGVTATVYFGLRCVASGSLRIASVTSGTEPDADGYVMHDHDRSIESDISHSFTSGLDIVLPTNGTVTASALIPGTYHVDVRDVAPNCRTPVEAANPITIVAGVETFITLNFTCARSSQIAFVRGAGEFEWEQANIAKTDIYLINSNGTGTIRLTSEEGADLNPAWSPDGERIVFASDRDGNREIYVMNADGSNPVRLTNHSAADSRPSYSPDGKRIAFVSERDGNAEIYSMDTDGANVSRLTNNPGTDTDPAWSPDGSRIAFRSNGNLYLMNANGSGAIRLTTTSDMEPAWSPDGKTIVFRSDGRAGNTSLWLMNADGSNVRSYMGWNYWRTNPDWSPDGRSIAFDDRDCWDYGPCPRGIVIGTVEGEYSIVIDDASEPAWRPR